MVEFYFFHHGRNVMATLLKFSCHYQTCPRPHSIKAVIQSEVNNKTLGKCFQNLHLATLFVRGSVWIHNSMKDCVVITLRKFEELSTGATQLCYWVCLLRRISRATGDNTRGRWRNRHNEEFPIWESSNKYYCGDCETVYLKTLKGPLAEYPQTIEWEGSSESERIEQRCYDLIWDSIHVLTWRRWGKPWRLLFSIAGLGTMMEHEICQM
jgi:hypothetical protein